MIQVALPAQLMLLLLLLLLLLFRASYTFLHDDRLERYTADIDTIDEDNIDTEIDKDISSSHSKAYDIYVRSLLLYNEGVSELEHQMFYDNLVV